MSGGGQRGTRVDDEMGWRQSVFVCLARCESPKQFFYVRESTNAENQFELINQSVDGHTNKLKASMGRECSLFFIHRCIHQLQKESERERERVNIDVLVS